MENNGMIVNKKMDAILDPFEWMVGWLYRQQAPAAALKRAVHFCIYSIYNNRVTSLHSGSFLSQHLYPRKRQRGVKSTQLTRLFLRFVVQTSLQSSARWPGVSRWARSWLSTRNFVFFNALWKEQPHATKFHFRPLNIIRILQKSSLFTPHTYPPARVKRQSRKIGNGTTRSSCLYQIFIKHYFIIWPDYCSATIKGFRHVLHEEPNFAVTSSSTVFSVLSTW